ncbi:MAG: EscU/YscU/HrcU family type III secretion system export apparatus switch protein [Treponema sp.]|nr:EscU/YscU/HrcU family type III secretion system export apparatus switch protein [Treponema sp.]
MTETAKKVAVALMYPAGADAPFITAKETGKLAERMIAIARENDIPIVEDDVLENTLSLYAIGSYIPEQTWLAVARIFAYIQDVENRHDTDRLQRY